MENIKVGKMSIKILIVKLVIDLILCAVLVGLILLPRDLIIFF